MITAYERDFKDEAIIHTLMLIKQHTFSVHITFY